MNVLSPEHLELQTKRIQSGDVIAKFIQPETHGVVIGPGKGVGFDPSLLAVAIQVGTKGIIHIADPLGGKFTKSHCYPGIDERFVREIGDVVQHKKELIALESIGFPISSVNIKWHPDSDHHHFAHIQPESIQWIWDHCTTSFVSGESQTDNNGPRAQILSDAANEWRRVLQPGGHVFFITNFIKYNFRLTNELVSRRYDPLNIQTLFEHHGFSVIKYNIEDVYSISLPENALSKIVKMSEKNIGFSYFHHLLDSSPLQNDHRLRRLSTAETPLRHIGTELVLLKKM